MKKTLINALAVLVLTIPAMSSATVKIGSITVDGSGKIIFSDKTEQETATLKGDKGDKGDAGIKGDKGGIGPKGDTGQVDKSSLCQVYALENVPPPPFCTIKKIIFLSSQLFKGDLGGLSGADEKCQTAAANAGFDGVFKAWLSDDTTSAKDRLLHNTTGPYVRTDGDVIAINWTDLVDGFIKTPIICDENKKCDYVSPTTYYVNGVNYELTAPAVWTNTKRNGDANPMGIASCNNWSSTTNNVGNIGDSNSIDDKWTFNYNPNPLNCDMTARLYCVEQ